MIIVLVWEVLILAALLFFAAAYVLMDPETAVREVTRARRELRLRWPAWRRRAGLGTALLLGSGAGAR